MADLARAHELAKKLADFLFEDIHRHGPMSGGEVAATIAELVLCVDQVAPSCKQQLVEMLSAIEVMQQ